MAGMKVQVVEVDKDGNIDLAHLKSLVRVGPFVPLVLHASFNLLVSTSQPCENSCVMDDP